MRISINKNNLLTLYKVNQYRTQIFAHVQTYSNTGNHFKKIIQHEIRTACFKILFTTIKKS